MEKARAEQSWVSFWDGQVRLRRAWPRLHGCFPNEELRTASHPGLRQELGALSDGSVGAGERLHAEVDRHNRRRKRAHQADLCRLRSRPVRRAHRIVRLDPQVVLAARLLL
eukprot:COSAG04_NODE_16013_length_512_cov_1.355932_1_plen_110_part_10